MKKLFLYFLLVPVFFVSCEEDEEVNPSIETLEATVESVGAINARASVGEFGSFEVLDYGFAHSYNENFFNATKVSLGTKPDTREFSARIPVNVPYSDKVYIGAYITNTKGTVYGNMIMINIPRLAVSSVLPVMGKPGDRIVITGSAFSAVAEENKVFFNETQAKVLEATPTQLTVEVPDKISLSYYGSRVSIKVQIGERYMTMSESFTVSPEFSYFSPESGKVGSLIYLYGKNINSGYSSDYLIFLGQKAVTPNNINSNYLTAYIPPDIETDAFPIYIMYKGSKFTLPGTFRIPPPEITSLSVEKGVPGNELTINGNNFVEWQGYNQVYFGDQQVTINNYSTNSVRVTVPSLAPGSYAIRIKNNLHDVVSATMFEILPPEFTGFEPASGGPETQLTIHGKNFATYAKVVFGSLKTVDVYSSNSSEITVNVPYGLVKGDNEIAVISGGIKITATQKFYNKGVNISGFTPEMGAPGTIVTLNGNGFSSNYYSDVVVKVGTATARIISKTSERIIIEIPQMNAGTKKITVVSNGEVAVSDQDFEVTAD
ncbi:MAG: IPT/TIG domain-containing protein [Prolixibacteraceae bacterium]